MSFYLSRLEMLGIESGTVCMQSWWSVTELRNQQAHHVDFYGIIAVVLISFAILSPPPQILWDNDWLFSP